MARGKRSAVQKAAEALAGAIGGFIDDVGDEIGETFGGKKKSKPKAKRKPIVSPDLIPQLTKTPQKSKPNTPAQRKKTREAYRKASPQVRKMARRSGGVQGKASRKLSEDWNRVEGYKREARDFVKSGDLVDLSTEQQDRIRKGLEQISKSRVRDVVEGFEPPKVRFKVAEDDGGLLETVTSGIGEGVARLVPGLSQVKMVGDVMKATGQDETVAENVREKLEDVYGPLQDVQREAIRGSLDGTVMALNELGRFSSASAGAAIAVAEGRNPLAGAAEGFASNDRSYREVAEKLGLDGFEADALGFVGDVGLDPLTYATLGASAPSKAAAQAVEEVAQRSAQKQLRQVEKWAKREMVAPDSPQFREALEAIERERRAFVDRKLARSRERARGVERKRGREARSVQVGVRAGGRTRQTSVVPQTVSKALGDAYRAVQQRPVVNEVTSSVNTRNPRVGITPEEQRVIRDADRRARGEAQRVLDDVTRVAFYVRKAAGGDRDRYRAIVGAIERGDLDSLPGDLRKAAERVRSANEDVRAKLSDVLGREIMLDDRMLAPGDLDKLLGRVVKFATRDAKAAKRQAKAAADKAGVQEKLVAFARRSGNPRRDPEFRRLEGEARAAGREAQEARVALEKARSRAKDSERRLDPAVRRAEADVRAAERVADAARQAAVSADRRLAVQEGREAGGEALRRRQLRGRIKAAERTQASLARRLDGQKLKPETRAKLEAQAADAKTRVERASEELERVPRKAAPREAMEERAWRAVDAEEAAQRMRAFADTVKRRTAGVEPGVADALRVAIQGVEEAAGKARAAGEELRSYRANPVTDAQMERLAKAQDDAAGAAARQEQVEGMVEGLTRGAPDAEGERDAVAALRDAVREMGRGRMERLVNQRTGMVLGAVRQGGEAAEAFPDLAQALRAEDEARARAVAARGKGEKKAEQAARKEQAAVRATIKEYREAIAREVAASLADEGMGTLGGGFGRLAGDLQAARTRTTKAAPAGYVPRQREEFIAERFGKKGPRIPGQRAGRMSAENARVVNRERLEEMDDIIRQAYSDDLPLLEASFGVSAAARIYRARTARSMFQHFGRRPTRGGLEGDETLVPYRKRAGDLPVRMSDDEARGMWAAVERGESPTDVVVIPEPIDKVLTERYDALEPGEINRRFRSIVRRWKELNTIARPGFFVTTAVGNSWQLYLADAKREIAQQFRTFARLKADEMKQKKPGGGILGRALDAVGANRTYLVDGKRVTTADLLAEATRYGAARTGSRVGYALDNDLRPEEIVGRQLTRPTRNAIKWASTKASNAAEDLDDATRGVLYVRARTKLGMNPEDATEYVYKTMIDYGDLTRAEQRYLRVLMPFYMYTSRNLPIQVRRLMQRPGKLANLDKLADLLAQWAGLPEDWEASLDEVDQERIMLAAPGVSIAGRPMFRDLRLPSQDLSRVAQLLEGDLDGLARFGKRFASDLNPALRAIAELAFNRRLDFDVPIYGPDARPAEAGALIRGIEKLQRWNSDETIVDRRTGEKYNRTNNVADYLARQFGGSYGSLILSAGTKAADRGGRTFPIRAADWVVGQGSVMPEAAETVLYGSVRTDLDKARAGLEKLRDAGRQGTTEIVEARDRVTDLEDLSALLRDALGDKSAAERVGQARRRKLKPRRPAELRAFDERIDAIRRVAHIAP